MIVFALFSALLIKHYLADFVLQPQWMVTGKGRIDSLGGYVHAGIHAAATGAILLPALPERGQWILPIAAAEFAIHYVIDYAKDRVAARPSVARSAYRYWQLHGLDQMLHQLTYVAIVYLAVAKLS